MKDKERIEYLESLIYQLTDTYEWSKMQHNGMCEYGCEICSLFKEIWKVGVEYGRRIK
jgi:hypothetical protein